MKNNKKGFTLAELLVVVAIIAVLVAIAIPVFTAQLEKSKEAVDAANIRAAYAELLTDAMGGGSTTTKEVTLTQGTDKWTTDNKPSFPENLVVSDDVIKAGKTIVLTYDSKTGKVTATLKS